MSHSNNKISNIQALRGIAVLLVMALHLASNEKKYGHGYGILPDGLAIGASGVDIFFVISGFVMAAITRGEFQTPGAILRFLYHRVTRIYPAYWFYSLIMLAVFWFQQQRGGTTRVVDLTASFLLLPQSQLPLLVVGWTLVHEMYFYLVFSLLLLFPERWLPALLLLWGMAAILGGMLLAPSESPAVQLMVNPLTLEFIAGGLLARFFYFLKKPVLIWPCLMTALVGWSVGYGLCARLGVAPEASLWLRVLVFGVPAVLAVHALVAMETYSGSKPPRWLVAIGDASFSIYLSHLLVIATLGRLWEKLGVLGPWINGAVLTAMGLAALAVGIASFHGIERPLLRLARRCEGAVIGAYAKSAT